MSPDDFILPDWPASARVRAVCTVRAGGVSTGPYASLNLGDHVGDVPAAVAANRGRLAAALGLPTEPLWLNQMHGCSVAEADSARAGCEADAAVARGPGRACAVLTADCLPVLFCDRDGSRVAAAHAGWRGLAAGVLEAAVTALQTDPDRLLAWLGPAIGPAAYEVGGEVRRALLESTPGAETAFRPSPAGRWLADLYTLARLRLAAAGVTAVYGGHWCTFTDAERFFSYRRDGVTGRMASLVWIAD
jgi:YfiH family protein